MKNKTRGVVVVEPNPVEGTIYIGPDDTAFIKVSQKMYQQDISGITITTRMTLLNDSIGRVISLGLYPGDKLTKGKILLVKKDGDIWSYYSENANEEDDIA